MWRRLWGCCWMVGLLACDGGGAMDASVDAGQDSGARDAAPGDADSVDAGRLDAGADGGVTDGGPTDGGATDGGPTDGGSTDGGPTDGGPTDGGSDAGPAPIVLPEPNLGFDYQLGEAYPPPSGVRIVVRDRTASPASGAYNICYVNGFQTQPHERAFWRDEHPDLLLRDGAGEPVVDPDWDEWMLDVTTADKRAALLAIVGGWIDGCARDGFDAVEIDNLDTYARSGGRVSQDDAVAFMRLLADRAHARGMAIAQKNSAEVLSRRAAMRTDFAVVEECNRYDECGDFTAAYGNRIYVIEYRRRDFTAGCAEFPNVSIVLRDLPLRGPSAPGYVYDGC